MANVDIKLGYKDSAWFTANPTLILKQGQIVALEQTGTYKLGDGVTQLSALTFLGGVGTVDVNTIGAAINGATSATPNDTDLVMSVDTSVAKKNTWTQIKAFLKTYFDTLFVKKGTITNNTILKGSSTDTATNSQITDDGTTVDIGGATSIGINEKLRVKGVVSIQSTGAGSAQILFKSNGNDVGGNYWFEGRTETLSNRQRFITQGGTVLLDINNYGVNEANFTNKVAIGGTFQPQEDLHVKGNIRNNALTPSQIVGTDASKNLVSLDTATYPSLTELSYTKGVTSPIQTQLDGKLSSTKERLLDIVGFSSLAPADATTYYFGEMHYAAPPTGQSSYRFQLNENVTIARAIILVRLTTVPSNESISFYIRESATTDYTITTSLNANTITSNVSKSFIYSGLNIAITAGNNYEMKMVTPTWATNPTNFSVLIKLYGY